MTAGGRALVALALLAVPAAAGALFEEDFEEPLYESPGHYVKDHALVRGPDGRFHLFTTVGAAGPGWQEGGNEIDFGHASSPDLIHWTDHPRVIPIDPLHGWKSRNVWAPHVLLLGDGTYLMAYTGVDSAINQAIGFAVSPDLMAWRDLSVDAGAYHADPDWARWEPGGTWSDCRDPFLASIAGELLLLTSVRARAAAGGPSGAGAIAVARSADRGRTWLDAGVPLIVNAEGPIPESSHLVRNPISGGWHLFYTSTAAGAGGIHVLTSAAATAGWDMATATLLDPGAIASEACEGEMGEPPIYSSATPVYDQDGVQRLVIRFDRLVWDGTAPAIERQDRFARRWTRIEGELGPFPTFGDRPAGRSGVASGLEGRCWINTAEIYAGPYGPGAADGAGATAGADESRCGVFRSPAFTIRGQAIELLVGGTRSPAARVALVDSASGATLRAATGSGSEVMSRRTWDVSDFRGRRVWIEIADRDPAGHLSVDSIREFRSRASP